MDTIQSTFQPKQRNSEAMRAFGIRLKNQFQTNESWRRFKELQWLEDLRAYKGLYDPEVKIDAGASKVYPKITRSKVNIVLSRLHEMLFPETDKNWEIEPTPEPKISPEKVREIVQNLMQQKMMEFQTQLSAMQSPGTQSQPQPEFKPPSVEDVRLAIKKYAEVTCQTMSSVIDDQLTEMDYPEETKKVLRSGLLYGTGVMKGPMVNSRTKHKWVPSDEDPNDFIENEDTDQIPYFEAVRIWDWYPDMTTTEIDLIDGSFERHVMNKHDLRLLLQRDDFYSDMIESYLETHPDGDYVPRSWEVDLQNIEVEAGAGRNNTNTGNTMMTGTTNTSETNRTTNRQMGKKYQVLEYWGYIDGKDLEACGLNIPDMTLEYKANVWLLGNLPIKAVLYNGALDMYKVFYYEKDETSLFGEGLARVMRHSQIAIAAADRMILDNGACVSGDTMVYRNHHSSDRPPEITVRQLWETKHQHNSGLRRMKLRSVDEATGEIIYNRIVDVFNNGIKPVFEVKTLHGYCIKATDDHRFMSDDGQWTELNKFCIGDNIAVNGRKEPLVKICIECGAPTVKEGALRCRKCASKKENSSWNMKQALDAEHNTNASLSTARQRWACQRDKKDYCERCGVKSETGVKLCIHHIDKNPYNNSPENKITCCQPCHVAIHHRHDYFGQPRQHVYIDYDEIVSIEYVGEEEVFDVSLEAPNHNFIANGFVVHNCVAGPQVEVNWSLLTPDTDFNSFYPRKIWYREGRGVEAQYPAIRSLGFDSHIEELLKIADHFRANADEETTLPTWMIGQMVNNETAQATSGRMATITVSIKDITKNFDAFTERIIRDLYSWNMDFNPRTDIKGDFNVKARGVSSLVMKEIRMQAINQMIPTLRPEDWVYIDSRDLLQKRMDAHDLNIKLRSEEEADKIREQQANSTMNKLQEEMLKSEIAKNNAQAMTNLTKAKEKNIIANKEAMTPPEQPNATDPRITDAQVAQEAAKAQGQDIQNQLMIDEHEHKKALADQEHGEKMMANRLEMAKGIEKHRNELEIKSKTAEHAMKVKEKAAKSKKPVKKQGE